MSRLNPFHDPRNSPDHSRAHTAENLVHGQPEQLAVLVGQAAQVRQETRRPDVLHSPTPRSASSSSIESYTLLSGTSSPGRDGCLRSCASQYSSASRCSSALSARYSSSGTTTASTWPARKIT